MNFLIQRADGTSRRVCGYRAGKPPEDAKRFTARHELSQGLPPKVDLRTHLTPVEDQAETSSCVANATAGAYEYLVKRHLGEAGYDVSRLFIYYNARAEAGLETEDGGSMIGDAITSLTRHGACSEETWPFDVARVNERPSDEAFQEASQFLIEDVAAVPTELDAWKQALAEGNPVIFGVQLFASFDRQRKPGLVPMPGRGAESRESHGAHAMLCVGYSDPDELFIVRNSWGTSWGDGGYCYIPYRYLMNQEYNGGDSWIIRRVDTLDIDDATWGDSSSILPDLDQELASMSEDEFGALIEALGDVPLETRLALVMLTAADADDQLSDPEVTGIARYLEVILQQIGSQLDAARVVEHALPLLGQADLLDETIQVLGAHLSKAALANVLSNAEAVAGADELADAEADFLDALVQAWQVDAGDA